MPWPLAVPLSSRRAAPSLQKVRQMPPARRAVPTSRAGHCARVPCGAVLVPRLASGTQKKPCRARVPCRAVTCAVPGMRA
eukprot:8334801-Pyramimonas_sp.AAC.1